MRFFKNIFSKLHSFVLWLLISAVFWGWIFTIVTDTTADKKVTVYCMVPALEDTALSVALEERMPEGLSAVRVHTFDYVMFNTEEFYKADAFILPASEIETYAELFAPVEGEWGVKVYDAATGVGIAGEYIQYPEEDCYLFLGKDSAHLEDGMAMEVVRELLAITIFGEELG